MSKNIYRNRFDDCKLFLGLVEKSKNCLLHLNDKAIFNNIEQYNFNKKIYNKDELDKFCLEKIKFDKIIITEIDDYKKLSIEIRLSIIRRLNNKGELIVFKNNSQTYINLHINYKNIFPNMHIWEEYSILPFYNNNPLFFLPIHKSNYIKYSLDLIISTVQTISPEVKSKFGHYYTLGLFILKQIKYFRFHRILSLITLGNIIILKKKE